MELLKSARAVQQMMAIACDVPVGNGSLAGKLTRANSSIASNEWSQ